jgi:hypothetical protein
MISSQNNKKETFFSIIFSSRPYPFFVLVFSKENKAKQ